jgi:hypothetical protein
MKVMHTSLQWRVLFEGAVRESLVSTASAARSGPEGTRAWERPFHYVADDSTGNLAILEFSVEGAVCAFNGKLFVPAHRLEEMLALAPPDRRQSLRSVCALPLLSGTPPGVTTVWWSEATDICVPFDWEDSLEHGAEVLWLEVMAAEPWLPEAARMWDLPEDVLSLAIALSRRARLGFPLLTLSREEFRLLIPTGSSHESEASELLLSEGAFEVVE